MLADAEEQVAVGGEGPVLFSGLGLSLIGYGTQGCHLSKDGIPDSEGFFFGIGDALQVQQRAFQLVGLLRDLIRQNGELCNQSGLIGTVISLRSFSRSAMDLVNPAGIC